MPTVSTPRGLTYTPPHTAITWSELHGDLVALGERELSLEAVDSILRLTADDGELLSVTVRCGLATGCCYVQTADRALLRAQARVQRAHLVSRPRRAAGDELSRRRFMERGKRTAVLLRIARLRRDVLSMPPHGGKGGRAGRGTSQLLLCADRNSGRDNSVSYVRAVEDERTASDRL